MTDSPEPSPAALRDLARAARAARTAYLARQDPDTYQAYLAARKAYENAVRAPGFIEALVDLLEDLARLVPNCDLPDTMPTTDDVMHAPLEPKHD